MLYNLELAVAVFKCGVSLVLSVETSDRVKWDSPQGVIKLDFYSFKVLQSGWFRVN